MTIANNLSQILIPIITMILAFINMIPSSYSVKSKKARWILISISILIILLCIVNIKKIYDDDNKSKIEINTALNQYKDLKDTIKSSVLSLSEHSKFIYSIISSNINELKNSLQTIELIFYELSQNTNQVSIEDKLDLLVEMQHDVNSKITLVREWYYQFQEFNELFKKLTYNISKDEFIRSTVSFEKELMEVASSIEQIEIKNRNIEKRLDSLIFENDQETNVKQSSKASGKFSRYYINSMKPKSIPSPSDFSVRGERKKSIQEYINDLKSENIVLSSNAAGSLGKLGDLRAVKPLIAALDSKYPTTVSNAAHSLGDLKDERAIQPLIKKLNEPQRDVQGSIIKGIIAFGDAAVKPLIDELKNNENLRVIVNATDALEVITREKFGPHYKKWIVWMEKRNSPNSPKEREEKNEVSFLIGATK